MSTDKRASDVSGLLTLQGAVASFGAVLSTAAVSVVIGPLGVLIALGVGVTGLLAGATTAFAVGQVVLVVLYPLGGPLAPFVLAEAGLGGLFLGDALRHPEPFRVVVATLVAGLAVGGGAWLVFRSTEAVWATGSVVVAGTAVLGYGLHRYERVRLGLVETS